MKQIKVILIALVTLFTTSLFAQKTEENQEKKDQPKHEIGIDALELIVFKKFELSYNYLLNNSESIGAQISIFPDNSDFWDFEGYQENFSIGLNYRHYFSKKYAQGFYIEVLAKYSNGKSFGQTNYNYDYSDYKRYNTFDVGFGVGYKFVSRRSFYIDANININRSLFSSIPTENNTYYLPSVKPTFNLTLGKRF